MASGSSGDRWRVSCSTTAVITPPKTSPSGFMPVSSAEVGAKKNEEKQPKHREVASPRPAWSASIARFGNQLTELIEADGSRHELIPDDKRGGPSDSQGLA